MARHKNPHVSGRDHFAALYRTELEQEALWLRYGAVEKANSVELLLNRNGIRPRTLLELGCGTGAVIAECQRRELATEFTAIDYSSEAIQYLASNSTGIRCMAADITDPAFRLDQSFDVVILSHVLEHLEEPLQFLRSLATRLHFRHLVAEVPLEDLLASRIKNVFRDRTRNTAGHVSFFTQRSISRLLSAADLRPTDHRRYAPTLSRQMTLFATRRDRLSNISTILKMGTACYLPRVLQPIWARLYHAHLAVLCQAPTKEAGLLLEDQLQAPASPLP